jgi:predicted DsbA family dithiol-disulfide isomerase
MMIHLKQVAHGLGLPFGQRTMTYNSRLAQELGKWAESEGQGHEFHNAVFRAYFAEGLNIGKPHVLVKVAESVNLNGKGAMDTIQSRTCREAVDLDWKRSYEKNVTAVPTFVFNGQVLVGAQKYEALEKILLSNKVERRNPN